LDREEEIDLFEYLSIIKKRIKFVIVVFFIAVILSLIYSFVAKKKYVADASVLPSFEEEREPSLGTFTGLAASLGFANFQTKSSSELYPKILESRPIIYSLLEKQFRDTKNNNNALLLDLIKNREKTREKRLQKGYKNMRKMINTNLDDKTGIVSIFVETDRNWLSKAIADTLIELLINYNKQTRTSKARENRIFIEEQLGKAEEAFNIADEKLTEHRKKNRKIEDSPELTRERGRLQLEYDFCRQNYINLKDEYEMAVLREVKDTPIINVLNTPIVPQYKSKPNRGLIVVISSGIGLIFGIIGAFILEYAGPMKKQ